MRLAISSHASCLLFLFTFAGAAQAAPHPVWKTDYGQAYEEARKAEKPLLVHFYADWCGPCKKMDRDVLLNPQVTKMIESGFVAVKINIDKNRDLASKFGINMLPADAVVSPDGKIVSQTEGAQSLSAYVGQMARIESKVSEARRANLAKSPPASEKPAAEKPNTTLASNRRSSTPAPGDRLVPEPPEDEPATLGDSPSLARNASDSRPKTDDRPSGTPSTPAGLSIPSESTDEPELALDGYCPVTLRNSRTWKMGSSEFALDFLGQRFQFLSRDEYDQFLQNPTRFAPRYLGCDPVVLSEQRQAIPGSTQFGAFFDGQLYLFENAENRDRFRSEPSRYSKIRHVMKASELRKRRA